MPLSQKSDREPKASDFIERWYPIIAQLPEDFAIGTNADGIAGLYYQKWTVNDENGSSLESIPILASIQQSAQMLSMVRFCKVLHAYGVPLMSSVPMYRVCIPKP